MGLRGTAPDPGSPAGHRAGPGRRAGHPGGVRGPGRRPGRRIEGAETFRRWMQDLADQAVADLAGEHFDIPDPIKTIECCIAPTHDGSIYYTDPAEDFSRPGQMWWAVPRRSTPSRPGRK